MAFQITPRFLEWVLVSTFLFFFFVTVGGQPFGFRRPSCFLNLPITFSGLAKVAIFTTKLHTKHQSSNLAKTVIRSTEPPLLPNPSYVYNSLNLTYKGTINIERTKGGIRW
jgi:hypothetical protein